MQYTQSMTDLVFAIRARLSSAQKQSIKTSNPELLGDLADIYHETLDITLRAHIEHLMTHAGTTWVALLHKPSAIKPVVRLHKMPLHASAVLSSRGAVA
ncbi:MAG TPA: hypothetical protein PKD17_07820 [Cellvibrionaceae bacterium]|nr:hypothetical protein [Cellvibrionaceae bacterium]HMY38269.1 hypothetical protein [Marinagarivorans sp.]HNG60637.1 hypothetical protein [Cellvibrionaceae bacterium]